MKKCIISVFFLGIFAAFLITPMVISILDKDSNVAAFFNVDEEENNNNEIEKKLEIKLISFEKDNVNESSSDKNKVNTAYLDKGAQYLVESLSPPPESYVL